MNRPLVLLVNPDDSPYPYESPPLGLFALGSFLEAGGAEVEYFDERHERLDRFGALLRRRPAAAGFSVLGGRQLAPALRLSRAARELSSGTRVFWGGFFPSRLPAETLLEGAADIVVTGEGEETALELALLLHAGRDISTLPGLALMDGARPRVNPARRPPDMGSLPFPYGPAAKDRLGLYRRLGPLALGYEASRGCSSACSFCYCPSFHGGPRVKPAAKLREEITALAGLGPVRIDIVDDLLAGGSGEDISALCAALAAAGVPWSANMRVDMATDGLLGTMTRSGCREIYLGLESDSDEKLALLGKGFRAAGQKDGLAALRRSGARAILSVIAGLPGERDTAAARRQALELAAAHPGSEVQIQSFVPLPGTPMLEKAAAAGFIAPRGLKGWAAIDHFNSPLPWLDDPLEASKTYLSSFFAFRLRTRYLDGFFLRAAALPLCAAGLLRIRSGFFGLYFEGFLFRALFAAAAAAGRLRFFFWRIFFSGGRRCAE